jgi:hypothetical protein
MSGEYRDGGYWYVLPVVTDENGYSSPGKVPGAGYAAFYGAAYGLDPSLVTIRTPEPVDLPHAIDVSLNDVIAAAGISDVPFARIEGK